MLLNDSVIPTNPILIEASPSIYKVKMNVLKYKDAIQLIVSDNYSLPKVNMYTIVEVCGVLLLRP